jgi:PAS domain S-box-containing protein
MTPPASTPRRTSPQTGIALLNTDLDLGRRMSLSILFGIGAVLAGGVLFDIWQDWVPEGKPLWSTLLENALPLLFSMLPPYAAYVLARSDLGESYLSETTKWAIVGAGSTLVISSLGVGLQIVQGELKPLIIVTQITTAGTIAGVLIGYSVAEIRTARAELASRDAQMQSIAENVSEGIFRFAYGDDGDAELTYVNPAFARLFGYDAPDEIIGHEPADFEGERGGGLGERFFESLRRARHFEGTDAEIEFERRDGTTFVGRVRSHLVRDEDGKPTYRDGVVADITEQKRYEDRLEAALEEAEAARAKEQAARKVAEEAREEARAATASKSRFLEGIVHDLKSPLSSIRAAAQIAESGAPESIGEPLSLIARGADQIDEMLSALSSLARLQSGRYSPELEVADVAAVVQEAAEAQRPNANAAGIDLSVRLPDGPLRRSVAPALVHRVVANLVGNALKYASAGDRVQVRLHGPSDDVAVLEVEDTGPGMSPDFVGDAFEPFARGNTSTEGTGLGLALTKEMVEAMNGAIAVESEAGEGTRFRIRLGAGAVPSAR